ncbi:MAG: M48 family peptidase [Ignavibacteriales bacterium]|nr:MAG: M48 family peptidase [Ignavibacteriales bacterium]
MDYKKYNNTKLAIGIGKTVVSFILILVFLLTGLSKELDTALRSVSGNSYIVLILFVLVTGVVSGILFFPVNFYSQYILEHKYNLSNQTILKWLWENIKGLLISGVIGIPVLLLFYYVITKFGGLWWLPFAVIMFIISVVLARIAPLIILPLFYKVTPYENETLKERIQNLAHQAGIKVENIFRFNMSKNTKKANAAFTGIGKSKRILLGDTLIESYSDDEIETVIAHELGHYKKKHIKKNIIRGTILSFLTLFLAAKLYEISLGWFDFNSILQIGALPVLVLWSMLIGLIESPMGSAISRKYEYEADEYAIDTTRKPSAFISTLKKLTDQNLADKEPHPFVELFFYSHPSIKNRLAAIRKYSAEKLNMQLADDIY